MRYLLLVVFVACLTACAAPSRLVYSSGFSFSNYDFVVMAKPEAMATSTSLYGLDIEVGNMLSRYNMNVIGEKELERLTVEDQARALFARLALSASNDRILLSLSFDDVMTGKTGASMTSVSGGDIFDPDDRDEALESVSRTVIRAIERDKGLTIEEEKRWWELSD